MQFTFDIFNLGNLINKDWGRLFYTGNDNFDLISFEGFQADGTTAQYTFEKPNDYYYIDDSGINSSRWQAQIGFRYII